MRISSYTLLISIMLILPSRGHAQEAAPKEEKTSKWKSMFSFNGIGVSADLFGFAYSLLDDYTSAEIAVEANLGNRFYPIAEIGFGWCNTTDETFGIKYRTAAPYYKLGLNYNFFTNEETPDPKHYVYGLVRIAWSGFEYDVTTPPITDPVWGGTTALDLKDIYGSCLWGEIGAGIKVNIYKGLHMGWSIRYKMRFTQKEGSNSNMWYIPGYGINQSTGFGGTYSITYDFPL